MIRKMVRTLIRIIQQIIIIVSLFVIYIFGFGITFVLAAIFNRRLLGIEKKNADTFWRDVQGYEPDINESMRDL